MRTNVLYGCFFGCSSCRSPVKKIRPIPLFLCTLSKTRLFLVPVSSPQYQNIRLYRTIIRLGRIFRETQLNPCLWQTLFHSFDEVAYLHISRFPSLARSCASVALGTDRRTRQPYLGGGDIACTYCTSQRFTKEKSKVRYTKATFGQFETERARHRNRDQTSPINAEASDDERSERTGTEPCQTLIYSRGQNTIRFFLRRGRSSLFR